MYPVSRWVSSGYISRPRVYRRCDVYPVSPLHGILGYIYSPVVVSSSLLYELGIICGYQ